MEKKKMSSKLSVAALIFSVIIFPVGIILAVIDLVKMLDPKYREEYGHLLSYYALGISAFFLIIFTFSRANSKEAEEPPKEEAMVITEAPEPAAEEPAAAELEQEEASAINFEDYQKESEPDPKPAEAPKADDSALSMSERNALREAESYLNYQAFSRQGLIDQLSSEYGSQFPVADAEKAVSFLEENNMVDWNEQAYKGAVEYLNYQAFSRQGLIDQLSSDSGSQFTREEAEYGVKTLEDKGEVDWNEQAAKAAKEYLDYQSFSRDGLIDQLSSDAGSQFTREQAEYGAASAGL